MNFITPQPIDFSLIEPKVIEFMKNTDHSYFFGKSWLEVANAIKQFDPRIIVKHCNLNNNEHLPSEIHLGTIFLVYRNDIVVGIAH
jgi:hypothetical protein